MSLFIYLLFPQLLVEYRHGASPYSTSILSTLYLILCAYKSRITYLTSNNFSRTIQCVIEV